ncbi:hypothetical protein THTE_0395 [Thermogutta terrifontis]|uniref:Uncharacterized protein n=1 Tax=Thermogutta terrifontis TaxID=1331910 RepID=A0A286RAM0_9BACT|nr:hypothetical protein THTE_0395 [Thermogutta terrifontis]
MSPSQWTKNREGPRCTIEKALAAYQTVTAKKRHAEDAPDP